MKPTRRPGRPPYAWLDGPSTRELPVGTAVLLETRHHGPRPTGRIDRVDQHHIVLTTTRGELTVAASAIHRARIVPGLYEPGDPVLRRHVPAADWRGGVVRTEGSDVLVEQIDGTFAWHPEADLEPADARDPALPPLPRGPVPARAS